MIRPVAAIHKGTKIFELSWLSVHEEGIKITGIIVDNSLKFAMVYVQALQNSEQILFTFLFLAQFELSGHLGPGNFSKIKHNRFSSQFSLYSGDLLQEYILLKT